MVVRKPGDMEPPDDAWPSQGGFPLGAPAEPSHTVAPTIAFGDLDEEPTHVSEEQRAADEDAWHGGTGETPDIGPPLLMDDIPEPTVGDDMSPGASPLFPEEDPWKGFSVKPEPRVAQPTIIPEPGTVDEADFVPDPLATMQPSGLPMSVDAGREPDQRRRNRDTSRPPPADLATLLARSGATSRAKPRATPEDALPEITEEPEGRPPEESGGTGYRWAVVVMVLAVVAAIAGTAITLVARGGAAPVTLPPPAERAPVEAETPSAQDDPTAGRTPPQGRSFVRFVSTPDGAVVRVDGDFVGRTPTTADLALGTHEVLMTLEGHAGFSKTIDVDESRERVETSLGDGPVKGPASIIAAGMEGARLWIDGRPEGTIPADVTLSPGLHKFKVSGPAGSIEVEREVWVLDGATVQIDLTGK